MTTSHRITVNADAPVSATIKSGTLENYVEGSRARALDEARADGHAAALTDAAATLALAAEALDTSREACLDEVASAAVELGLGIAQSLVRSELSDRSHDIEAIVREVLAAATQRRTTTRVLVSPDDAERLKEVTFRAATEIVADESISTGSVRGETPQGALVRDIDESLRAISARLKGEISK